MSQPNEHKESRAESRDQKQAASDVKYDLDDLVAQITEDNAHGEVDTDNPVGNEVW